jgi:hypothetical protein
MTSRTKEPPFVEMLICWEFYFSQFKVGGQGSARHVSLCFVSARTSRYKQNNFSLFPELNVVSKGTSSNGITMIQAISWDALANFKQCTTGNVSEVSAITRLVVRSPKETTPNRTTLIKNQMSLWRNKFSSETAAQGKQ